MFVLTFLIGFVLSLVIFIANRIVSGKNGNIKRFKLSRYLLFCNITSFTFYFWCPCFWQGYADTFSNFVSYKYYYYCFGI